MSGESTDSAGRPARLTCTPTAGALVPVPRQAGPAAVPASDAQAGPETDRMLTMVYRDEYRSLVRLAILLLYDVPTAEEVVQEAFAAMHQAWRRLRDTDKALPYLRREVVIRSRSALRHRAAAGRYEQEQLTAEPGAESRAIALLERSALTAALRGLPTQQREAIVLRHYAGLSDAETAATMGISKGAVKTHTARAMTALRPTLEHHAP